MQQVRRRFGDRVERMNQSLPAREEHSAGHCGGEYNADFKGEGEAEQYRREHPQLVREICHARSANHLAPRQVDVKAMVEERSQAGACD